MTYHPPCEDNPELWFAQETNHRAAARTICRTSCDLREACYRLAIQHPRPEYGIWAGYSANELRRMAAA